MTQFPLDRRHTRVTAHIRRTQRLVSFAIFTLVALATLGATQPARAQGSRKDDIIFNAQGRPMAGATVRVCTSAATGQPCMPLANIYSDVAQTQALANPLTTDGLGNYTFYAAPGRYEIEISGPGITTKQLPNVILPNDPNNPTFTSLTTGSGLTMFSLSLSGNLTVNGSTAVNGTLTVGGAPVPSTNQQNTWTANQQFVGPSPWIDMTAFPSSAACPWTANSIPSVTISLGTPTTAAANFADTDYAVGCSIYIPGAGPNSTIGAPTGGTIINHNGTGSTTYKYKIVAVDANNGYGPASTQFQTTTGIAAMNKWQYNFLTWTAPSGTVKEYVIYSDEGTGGSLVKIGTSYFPTFEDTGFYGANMQPSPSFLPTNPPSADGPQGLFTKIAAVSGTTITLANAATHAVTSQLAYLDNGPALLAAGNAYCTNGAGGVLQVGAGRWMVAQWPTPACGGFAVMRLIGDLIPIDGPIVMAPGEQIYGAGSFTALQPFGNDIVANINTVQDYGNFGADQLGTLVLGNQHTSLTGIQSIGFQGDFIQFGNVGTATLQLFAASAAHGSGCVVHLLSQVIGPFDIPDGVLDASTDAGGKAAICVDTQFDDGAGSTKIVNMQFGSTSGKQLNWQNHFISWACPICTEVRPEDNNQILNSYGESLREPGAIIVDPGTVVGGVLNGVDDLYSMAVFNINNDNDVFTGPCFSTLKVPNHTGFGMDIMSLGFLGCGNSVTQSPVGVITPTGTADYSYLPPITILGLYGNVGYNQHGFSTFAYGLNQTNALLPPNTGVALTPNGNENTFNNCVECWVLPGPTALSITTTVSAGTLAAGLHCYVVTANDKQSPTGNTVPSPEACVTNSLNDENILSYTLSGTGLSGATVWRGTSSGGENVYLGAQPTTNSISTYIDNGSATPISGTPVYQSNAYDSMFFNGATGSKGFLHGNAIADALSFGFGCPPSGTYVWETCGNTGFDNNVTIAGSLTAGGRTNFFSAGGRLALTDAATISFNVANLPNPWANVTIGGNRTLAVTNMVAGGNYMLSITQDGTGSRTLTLGTGGTGGCTHWYVSGGGGGAITLTTTPAATDLLGWKYDGTNCWAILNTNFN